MRQTIVVLFLVLNYSAFSQRPTVAASNLAFGNVGCNELLISWTNGNGSDRVVFIRQDFDLTSVPEDDQFYTLDSTFGKGESILNDNTHFCVYRGKGSRVKVSGLKKGTKYCIAVFEYNVPPGKYSYLTASYVTKCLTTYNIIAKDSIAPLSQCRNGNIFKFTDLSATNRPTPNAFTYKWNFGDGKTSTVKNPTHSYATHSIYIVKLVVQAPGCIDSVFLNDTVNAHPVVKFDLDPTKPRFDSIQCFLNNRFTFRNKSILPDIGIGLSSMDYQWFIDDKLFYTGYKADIHVQTPGQFRIKLVATSIQGCKDSSFIDFKVLPRAIDSTKVIFNSKSMCLSGNEFIVTNNSPNSISHKWTFGDTPLDNDTFVGKSVTHKYAKVGKYRITIYANDNAGCLDIWHDSVEVVKNTSVTFTGLLNQYCLNDKPSILKPFPGKGEFFGTNVNNIDSTFTPRSLGKTTVNYVFAKGSCRDTFSQTTEVFDLPVVKLGKDTIICIDRPLQLNANPAYVNSWTGGVSGNFYNVKTSGKYTLKSVLGICTAYDTIDIKAINSPVISNTNDTTLCGGSFLKFNLKVDLGSVFWSDGSNLKDRNISQSGFYKYTVFNKCGSVSDSFNLKVEETACVIFFPNAFTPNGDLLNDAWLPFGKYDFIQMNIFNRWGEKVYFSDKSAIWDGYSNKNLCLDGVYSIVFQYLIQDGNTTRMVTKGLTVHLIR